MSTYWLRNELAKTSNASTDNGDPILSIMHRSGTIKIYCPDSDEYAVNADVVEKAAALGATVIAYSNTWCKVTYEAKAYGRDRGVDLMPFGGLFAYLRKLGITFSN